MSKQFSTIILKYPRLFYFLKP